MRRTVVDLLERDHRVCRQIVLRILVEEEGLWRHGALLLGRRHGRVLVARVHDCRPGAERRGRPAERSGRRRRVRAGRGGFGEAR